MVESNKTKEVWLADDSQIIRFKVGKTLRGAGYTVNEFTNADDIIAEIGKLGQDKDVVIVTDNQMPNSDGTARKNNGIEVLKAANDKRIKTIMISASSPNEQSKEVAAAGTKADAHFDKTNPDYIPSLISKVGELLQYTPTPVQQASMSRIT